MPELPEIDALASHLATHAVGSFVTELRLGSLYVLRTVEPSHEALVGAELESVGRRGKFLLLGIGGLTLAVHFARAGWLRWYEQLPAAPLRPGKGPVALRIGLGGPGLDLTEAGTKKSLAVWCVRAPEDVERIAALGPDAAAINQREFARVMSAERRRIKTVLTAQPTLAGIGNGLSDEIAHRAKLSPFAAGGSLDDAELDRLWSSLQGVLADFSSLRGLPPSRIKAAKKKLMVVHGREGEPCPVCGSAIASVNYTETSLQYCPGCQTGGKRLSDRRMDRLLR